MYSKNRLLEAMEFKVFSGMEMVDLDLLSIYVKTPVIDRYGPMAYAIVRHIHYVVSRHAGHEICNL